jgi:hypothetical protein
MSIADLDFDLQYCECKICHDLHFIPDGEMVLWRTEAPSDVPITVPLFCPKYDGKSANYSFAEVRFTLAFKWLETQGRLQTASRRR